MELLAFPARRQGRVVGRDELFQEVWKGVFVSDDALTRCIGELRRAFEDDARDPAILHTVPKRGYMLAAPVTWNPDLPSAGSGNGVVSEIPAKARQPLVRKRGGLALGVFCALLAAIALIAIFRGFRPRPSAHASVHRLAVLPLMNLTGDPAQEYFADGVTEQLITELAQIRLWEVISHTSVMRFKQTREPLRQVASELSADWIIEGSVQRSGKQVRITAQLIDAGTDVHLWSDSLESDAGDVFSLESRLARDLAAHLEMNLTRTEKARLEPSPRIVPEAYDDFLTGLYFHNRAQFAKAADNFERATLKDPNFALAYAYLWEADSMSTYVQDLPWSQRSLAAARRALELNGNLAEVHSSSGDILFYGNWQWQAGEAEFRRAVELDPNSADSALHYASCLHVLRHWETAIAEYRRALRLDPVSPMLNRQLLSVLVEAHRYAEAETQFRRARELDPNYGPTFRTVGELFQNTGRQAEAIAAFLRADSLSGATAQEFALLQRAATNSGLHGYWAARLQLLQARARHSRVPPLDFAAIYAGLGDSGRAMEMLEKAFQQRSQRLVWINCSARWDSLRSDPRFQSLLRRMQFPD